MRYITRLMDTLYSDSTSSDLKSKVAQKVDEAQSVGASELHHDGENLKLTQVGDSVLIHDVNTGEQTLATPDESTVKLSGIPKPEDQFRPEIQVNTGTAVAECSTRPITSEFSDSELDDYLYSDLIPTDDGVTLTFSESEVATAQEVANDLADKVEKLKKTDNPELADEVASDASELKSYSTLAESAGWDMSDIKAFSEYAEEVAEDAMFSSVSDTPVTEIFSDATAEEINCLGPIESEVLFSLLKSEDDTITFSDYNEIVDDLYSNQELYTPIVAEFSNYSDSELDALFSSLSEPELDTLIANVESNPNVTFSEINDQFELLNTDVTELFSDMSEDELLLFSERFGDEFTNATFSVAESGTDCTLGEAIEMYSDCLEEDALFSDEDYYEETQQFSEEDLNELFSDEDMLFSDIADQIDQPHPVKVEDAVDTLDDAAKELVEDPHDTELASHVKDLADKTAEHIDALSDGSEEDEELKDTCHSFSELTEDLLEGDVTLFSDDSYVYGDDEYQMGNCLFSRIN